MSSAEEQYERQRRHQMHQQNLSGGQEDGETAEILRALSEIDDLPINPGGDRVLGQLVSKLTSTANLTAEQVRSNEWVREYILILYLSKYPSEDGVHGSERAFVHDDMDAAREPMDAERRAELEAFIPTSKLALTRSEEAKVIEESTRNVNESIVNDGEGGNSGGGILGRLGIR